MLLPHAPRRAAIAVLLAIPMGADSNTALFHQRLISSVPAAGARLDAPPSAVRLVFAEPIRGGLITIEVVKTGGRPVVVGPPRHPGDSLNVVIADVGQTLAPGDHEIRWATTSADGHPVTGTVKFVVEGVAVDSIAPDTSRAARNAQPPLEGIRAPGVASPGYVSLRWVTYASLILLFGALVFERRVMRRLETDGAAEFFPGVMQALTRAALLAGALMAITAVAKPFMQAAVLRPLGAPGSVTVLTVLSDPRWSASFVLQFVAGLFAVLLFGRRRVDRRAWRLAGLACLAALAPALTGHAASSSQPMTGVLLDSVHILAAGFWLGGLACLALIAVPAAARSRREPYARTDSMDRESAAPGVVIGTMLRLFNPIALLSAAVLLLSGAYAAWMRVGSIRLLLASSYGQILVTKVLLVGLMGALGWLNWRILGPATSAHGSILGLRRSTRLETVLGALVLLVTSILVATAPPRDDPGPTESPPAVLPPP